MRFSRNFLKLGKSKIVNGFVDENNLEVFYSKDENKTNYKKISLANGYKVSEFNEINSCTELIKPSENIKIFRLGNSYKINVLSTEG